ncbi:MAG TPA: rod shape-determining protein MreC [Candidatus Paceibacterota bacterium]|nr:rod shape-determining protein MreC [Candidatus Paceibacterota bacterium]
MAAIILSVGCLYMWYSPITSALYSAGVFITAPFWSMQGYLSDSLASFMINFDSKKALIEKNDYLTKQLNSFKSTALENKLIRDENIELKKILGREEPSASGEKPAASKTKKLLAYVLSGPVTPPYDSLIIDVGSDMGVAQGDLVLNDDNYVMGEVVEATSGTSKVRLLSAYGQKTGVLLGDNKTMIEMVGQGSGNFFIAVPKEFLVKESDSAIFPGPDFKMVANVESIEGKDGEMFKNVYLSAPFNIKEIRMVAVVKKII